MPKVAKKPAPKPPGFAGFDRDAMGFWHELAAEMNRDWFLANKERYETKWVQPMTALLSAVGAKVASAYKPLAISEPKVMRIYRDTRFAKDKSPYKTWIGASINVGPARKAPKKDAPRGDAAHGVTALYMHFGVDEEFSGSGQYVFMDDVLVKWRKKVADDKSGKEIARIIANLEKSGYKPLAYDTLQRVPKPYDADHPRAELLKLKGLVVGFPDIPKGLVHKPELVDWLAGHVKAVAPMNKWIVANL
jgi:uncharacterized protein (TIGR02453 family)